MQQPQPDSDEIKKGDGSRSHRPPVPGRTVLLVYFVDLFCYFVNDLVVQYPLIIKTVPLVVDKIVCPLMIFSFDPNDMSLRNYNVKLFHSVAPVLLIHPRAQIVVERFILRD